MDKILIVGGHFGYTPKESGIITKIFEHFKDKPQEATVINGGQIAELRRLSVKGFDLVLWFPDVNNRETKYYPRKDTGTVLICSKVINHIYSRPEMISRIFAMHANAIVLIKKPKPFNFEFIDALNNTWRDTHDLHSLIVAIQNLCSWTKGSTRVSIHRDAVLDALVELNRRVADQHEADMGRYFGNVSTRCMKMFPSTRFFFSRRNVNKAHITADDMVLIEENTNGPLYYGTNKPSIDTPVQLELYRKLPKINYFIHGHAYVPDWPETSDYYPCGDLREVLGITLLIGDRSRGIVNLKKHGFLIYASTLAELMALTGVVKFAKKEMKW